MHTATQCSTVLREGQPEPGPDALAPRSAFVKTHSILLIGNASSQSTVPIMHTVSSTLTWSATPPTPTPTSIGCENYWSLTRVADSQGNKPLPVSDNYLTDHPHVNDAKYLSPVETREILEAARLVSQFHRTSTTITISKICDWIRERSLNHFMTPIFFNAQTREDYENQPRINRADQNLRTRFWNVSKLIYQF